VSEQDRVPFLDLVAPHLEMRAELVEVFTSALESAGFIGGPLVEGFERDFAAFCGAAHCVGVGSGTDALRFALAAAGVGPGDAVVTAPNSFIATTEAITQVGARPLFVDIDADTYCISPQALRRYLERDCRSEAGRAVDRRLGVRIAALVPVHLYGAPADMDALLELAEHYRLTVVEDACQAHGTEYFSRRTGEWRRCGTLGAAAAFSFYPGKNLGACGEAGAVTTNDAAIAHKIRMLRDHGQSRKYYHDMEGYNGRLDAIQAGILQRKLPRLAAWNEQRRALARRYHELLAAAGLQGLASPDKEWARSVHHLFVVRVAERDALIRKLAELQIGTGVHYPVPLHLQRAYLTLGYASGDFPVSEAAAAEVLSLPLYPQLRREQQERVVSALRSCLARTAPGPVPGATRAAARN
jgi:dTDP-4-amino-4,6-dideoxygalactose transaminase